MIFTETRSIAVALAIVFFAAPSVAMADKGGKPDKGKGKPHQEYRHDDNYGKGKGKDKDWDKGSDQRDSRHFGDKDRTVIRDYYGHEARSGHCPPGLAKKGNGCMPPGQAKKWARGRPLPHDVVYYELPHDLIARLPPPPSGHRYVRVAGDVLLIAVGSSMVVDAIQDIFR